MARIEIINTHPTVLTDTDVVFAPDAGEKFRITETRISGVWLILSLRDKNEKWLSIFLSTEDTGAAIEFGRTIRTPYSKDSLLGHWLSVKDGHVVFAKSDTRSFHYDANRGRGQPDWS